MYSAGVRKLGRYARLTSDDKNTLAQILANRQHVLPARQQILNHGDQGRRTVYLMSGWACRHQNLEDGRSQIISFLVAGDIYDSGQYVGEGRHYLRTITDSVVVVIDPEGLDALLLDHPNLAKAFHIANLVDLATLRERVMSLGQRTATERCGHMICELFWRLRAVGLTDAFSFTFPLTQEEIGGALGVSTVHANRVLQSLRRAGLIEQRGKRLNLPDLPALEALSFFNPHFLHLTSGLNSYDPPDPQTSVATPSTVGAALQTDLRRTPKK